MRLNEHNLTEAIGKPVPLFAFDPAHEWERFGAYNQNTRESFIEGSWMIKLNGRYFLTYSAPGTQFPGYAMGTYVSDSPLSGFVYQQRNPITECRSDIIKGAGHGCLVKGPADTLWAFYTCQISYVDKNERRIGMDPAGIGGNGNLFVAPVSDTLQWKPGLVRAPEKGNAMGLKPVSLYQLERATTASSFAPGREGIYASDPSMLTWWEPNPNDSAPWLEIDLRGEYELSSMRILWRDPLLFLENGYRPGPYRYALFGTVDGERWEMICDMRDNDEDMPVDYIEFPAKKASKIRLRLYGAPQGVWPGVISVTTFGVMK